MILVGRGFCWCSGWPGAGKSEVAAQVVPMLKDSESARLGAVSLRAGSSMAPRTCGVVGPARGILPGARPGGLRLRSLPAASMLALSTGTVTVSDSVVMGDVVGVRLVLHSGADLLQVYRNVVVPVLGSGAGGQARRVCGRRVGRG